MNETVIPKVEEPALHPLDPSNRLSGPGTFPKFLKSLGGELYNFVMCLFGLGDKTHFSTSETIKILRNAGIIVKLLWHRDGKLVFQFYYNEKAGNFCTMAWSMMKNLSYLEFARQGVIIIDLDQVKKTATNLIFVPGLPKALSSAQIARAEIRAGIEKATELRLEEKQDGTSVHCVVTKDLFVASTNNSSQISEKIAEELGIAIGMNPEVLGREVFAFYKELYPELESVAFNLELHQIGFHLVTLHCPGTIGVNHVNLVVRDRPVISSDLGSDQTFESGITMLEVLEAHLRTLGARVAYRFRKLVKNNPDRLFSEYYQEAYELILKTFRAYWHEDLIKMNPSLVKDLPRSGEPVADEEAILVFIKNRETVITSMEGWVARYQIKVGESLLVFHLKLKTDFFRVINALTYNTAAGTLDLIRSVYAEWAHRVYLQPHGRTATLLDILGSAIGRRMLENFDAAKRRIGAGKFVPNKDVSQRVAAHDVEILQTAEAIEALKAALLEDRVPAKDLEKMLVELVRTSGRGRFMPNKFPKTCEVLSSLGLLSYAIKHIEPLLNMQIKLYKRFHGIAESLLVLLKGQPGSVEEHLARILLATPEHFYDLETLKKYRYVPPVTVEDMTRINEVLEGYSAMAREMAEKLSFDANVVFVDVDATTFATPPDSLMRYPHHGRDGRTMCAFSWNLWNQVRELFPVAEFYLLTGAKISSEEALALLPQEVRQVFSGAIVGTYNIDPALQKLAFISTLAQARPDLRLTVIDDDRAVLAKVAGYARTIVSFPDKKLLTTVYPSPLVFLLLKTIGLPGSGKSTMVGRLIRELKSLAALGVETEAIKDLAASVKMNPEALKAVLETLVDELAHFNFDDLSRQDSAEGGHLEALEELRKFLEAFSQGRYDRTQKHVAIVDTLGKAVPQKPNRKASAEKPPTVAHMIFLPQGLCDHLESMGFSICQFQRTPDMVPVIKTWMQDAANQQTWIDVCKNLVDDRANALELDAAASTITPTKFEKNIASILAGVLAAVFKTLETEITMVVPIRVQDLSATAGVIAREVIKLYASVEPVSVNPVYTGLFFQPESITPLLEGTELSVPETPHVTTLYKPVALERIVRNIAAMKSRQVKVVALRTHADSNGTHFWLEVVMTGGMQVASGCPHITISSPSPSSISGFIAKGFGAVVKSFPDDTFVSGVLGAMPA